MQYNEDRKLSTDAVQSTGVNVCVVCCTVKDKGTCTEKVQTDNKRRNSENETKKNPARISDVFLL